MKRWLLVVFALPSLALAAEQAVSPGVEGVEHGARPGKAAQVSSPWQPLVDGLPATTEGQFNAFGGSAFPAQGWTLEADGSLHGHGGPDLISKEIYGNFELEAEWKAASNGNSGIFYRIRPMAGQPIYENAFECQVLGLDDAAKCHPVYRPGALYNLYGGQSVADAKPVGAWNKVRIVVQGNHVIHELNGVRVVDCLLRSADYAKRLAKSKFAKVPGYGTQTAGPIGLQSDGGEVWYRNVKIRKI